MKNFFIDRKSGASCRPDYIADGIIKNEIACVVSADIDRRDYEVVAVARNLAKAHNVVIIGCDKSDSIFLDRHGDVGSRSLNRVTLSSPTGSVPIKDFVADLAELVDMFHADVVVIENYDSIRRIVGSRIVYALADACRRLGLTIVMGVAPRRAVGKGGVSRDSLPLALAPVAATILDVPEEPQAVENEPVGSPPVVVRRRTHIRPYCPRNLARRLPRGRGRICAKVIRSRLRRRSRVDKLFRRYGCYQEEDI